MLNKENQMKCFVKTCNKQFKNALAVSHHIKMSAINCQKHKNYLIKLSSSIIKGFDKNFNVYKRQEKF